MVLPAFNPLPARTLASVAQFFDRRANRAIAIIESAKMNQALVAILFLSLFAPATALPPPLGKFVLSPLSNLTLFMRHCEKDLFATPKTKSAEFNTPMVWNLVKGLSKEPGTVSFQSSETKMYLQESIYNLQKTKYNGLTVLPVVNVTLASFRVTSGISNPEQFSFLSSSGKYISLNNSLSVKKCQFFGGTKDGINMQRPDSDLTLLDMPQKKSDATWLLNLP